jgi:pilus assembly protein CpaB
MSSNALKIIAAVTVLLAIVLAVVAFQMTRSYSVADEAARDDAAQGAEQAARDPAETMPRAVVAVAPLAANEPISAEQVRVAPVAVQPQGYFSSVEDVVNRIPLVDVDAGAPLTGRYFRESNPLARIVPEGHKAVSLEVDDVIAVGGFLQPGDTVDVLVYLRGGSGVEAVQARQLLPAVRVLALEDRIIDRPEGLEEEDEQERRRRQRTVVLAVPDDKVTRLMLGSSLGEVRLAMHGQKAETAGLDALAEGAEPVSDAELARAAEAAADDAPGDGKAEPDDAPVTAAALSAVEEARKASQRPPPHRIHVYHGADVKTVLD